MLRRTSIAVACCLPFLPALAAAQVQKLVVDQNHSLMGFKIRHLVSKVSGRFDQFEGEIQIDPKAPESMSITGKIMATSIDTNQPNRDNDLRSPNFFDVEKCPEITFKSTKVVKSADTYKVTGDLTMHCVTKPVVLEVTVLGFGTGPRGGVTAGFEARGKINRQDFGINWNRVLDQGGTMLGDDVELDLQIEAKPPAPVAPAPAAAKYRPSPGRPQRGRGLAVDSPTQRSTAGEASRLQRLVQRLTCGLVEAGKLLLQPFHRGAPLGRGGFADGVLVTEEADLLGRHFQRHGVQPADGHEVLAALRIVDVFTVVAALLGDLEDRDVAGGCGHSEGRGRLCAARHATHADEAGTRHLHPQAVAGAEQLQRLAVPRAAAATDERVLHRVRPRARLPVAE
jgi:polyisoprenoid-binding protein YceI